MAESRPRGRYGRYQRELLMLVDILLINALFWALCRMHPDVTESYGRLKWLLVSVSYLPVARFFERTRLQRTLHVDRVLIHRYMIRHMVKPGITGWAQVCGLRGNTDELIKMEKRVKADVWYIEHWSAMLDLKIIIKTVVNGFRGDENAY